jgi:hypothetical protein
MLIKPADDRSQELAELEALVARAAPGDRRRLEKDVYARRAGLRGETESAYHIDFHFAQSRNWAVIHDLRIEHDGRVAQVDHLLLNRTLDIYVLETKHFHSGLKITEEGEFLRWNDYRKTFEGMPSPLMQNERHIDVLRQATERLDLPTRLGIRLKPSFQTLVLVSPQARVDRPKKLDTSRVIKADQLKQRIHKDIDDESALTGLFTTFPKIVSSETVERLARGLAAMHVPQPWTKPQIAGQADMPAAAKVATATPNVEILAAATALAGPSCKHCGVNKGQIQYGKYGYYFKCDACGGNTGIRFTCQPGHTPRLRKQGAEFFRECADCGTCELYFRST